MTALTLRYAATDQDVVAIHAFLCVVSSPTLPGQIDPKNSATEVWRVVKHECALMAMRDDYLVGTLGLIRPEHWWSNGQHFLANRWFFALPGTNAGALLLREAIAIARASDLELFIFDEGKCRMRCFNRDPRRDQRAAAIKPAFPVASKEQRPTLQ